MQNFDPCITDGESLGYCTAAIGRAVVNDDDGELIRRVVERGHRRQAAV